MKKLVSLFVLALSTAAFAKDSATHTIKLESSEGPWTLVFPVDPGDVQTLRKRMSNGQECVDSELTYGLKGTQLLQFFHDDCPTYTIPDYEKKVFLDLQISQIDSFSVRPGRRSVRQFVAPGFIGQESRMQYDQGEVVMRTFIGEHSVLMLTASWRYGDEHAAEAAKCFIETIRVTLTEPAP